jgi:general secretion pathway protein K
MFFSLRKAGIGGEMLTCSQRGAILIIVLWFVVIATIIVAVLASETRLSAKAVFYNKMGLQTWNDTLKTLRAAEMELLFNMDRTYEPPGVEDIPLSERKKKKYRFDGRVVDLFHYPNPDRVTVRIYDHAGKIKLSWPNLYKLLKKRLPNDPEKLSALKDAWDDWFDEDDDKRLNGAEKDYYETLSPPYEPRNDRKARNIETVEELLLIKGFAEVFKGVEISNAFTLYSNTNKIDPNLATREALMVLPGLDSETVNTILTKRREEEFKNKSDFNEFMEPEQLTEFWGWVSIPRGNVSRSRYYTIAIQVKKPEEIAKLAETKEDDTVNTDKELEELDETTSQQVQKNQRAYMVTVETRGKDKFPRILMVNPYGVLPDTHHEQFSRSDDNHSKNPSTPFK